MEGNTLSHKEEETLIQDFIDITSSTREEAVFFLESHQWNLESSIESFFEDHHAQPSANPLPPPPVTTSPEEDDDDEEYQPEIPVPAVVKKEKKDKKASGSGSRGRIRTFSDLKAGDGSDSDDEGKQEYYTGGEKSGMLVQDPSRGGHDVDSIFDQARQMGAMQGTLEPQPSSSSRSFTGTGRLLSGETVSAVPQPPEEVVHNIYFWTNGFTINDGPLRRFDDPENAPFLESIRKSECPKELEPEDRRTAVSVNLMRKEENCPEPVKRPTPFQGVGRTLGGASSTDQGPAAATLTTNSASSVAPVVVDESLPTTSIQLRLADGTRTVARFNTSHTVGDIRVFINTSRTGPTSYTLQTVGFPPKQLTDVNQTIAQAGLANSVVIQKL